MTIVSGTITTPNTPQQLTTNSRSFQMATFYGFKALASNGTGVNNVSGLWLGPTSGASVNYIIPGDVLNYTLPYNNIENISNFYMVGAVGDGVVAILY
jgi:hypothetical protein